jgi:N-acetyl sugar amidotransferase
MEDRLTNQYEVCPRCVMDSSAREFSPSPSGGCSFCDRVITPTSQRQTRQIADLESLVSTIKASGKNRDYDCVVGVSGGLDSSFALHKCVELGLRPLAVHMDNGWNSSEAANNISNLVSALDVDLVTYVTDWESQKALQRAFFDADVIDIELIYDNCMLAVCYQQARKHKVNYILGGNNSATEGVAIPEEWAVVDKWDATNVRAIARAYGVKLEDYPLYSNLDWLLDRVFRKIHWLPLLDYFPNYNKAEATDTLVSKYGYRPYSTKHFENVFTRFYQGYILPQKFKVDKRKPHLSSLILSGQMTREEAVSLLKGDAGYTQRNSDLDMAYVLTKMSMTQEEFQDYIARPRREHSEWRMDSIRKYLWPLLSQANKLLRAGKPL